MESSDTELTGNNDWNGLNGAFNMWLGQNVRDLEENTI